MDQPLHDREFDGLPPTWEMVAKAVVLARTTRGEAPGLAEVKAPEPRAQANPESLVRIESPDHAAPNPRQDDSVGARLLGGDEGAWAVVLAEIMPRAGIVIRHRFGPGRVTPQGLLGVVALRKSIDDLPKAGADKEREIRCQKSSPIFGRTRDEEAERAMELRLEQLCDAPRDEAERPAYEGEARPSDRGGDRRGDRGSVGWTHDEVDGQGDPAGAPRPVQSDPSRAARAVRRLSGEGHRGR